MAGTLDFSPTPAIVPTSDGLSLRGRIYDSDGEPRYVLLILGGIGVPQRAFRHLGAWCARRGVRVVTVDYRGIGESPRDRLALSSASLSNWASLDAVGALRFVEASWPGAPVVLLGHSFGGQVLGFSDEFRRLRAAVLIASQFGAARHWDGVERWKVLAYWHLILPTAAALFREVPGWTGIGENIPSGVAREWALWGRTHDWLLPHVSGAEQRYANFDRPLRAYAISDDPIAPPRAVSALLRQFRTAPLERIDLEPADFGLRSLGHIGLFRPGPSERVWQQILDYGTRG
jgi:predicted alpha/beta hydrolase